jgi:hypothetical protein
MLRIAFMVDSNNLSGINFETELSRLIINKFPLLEVIPINNYSVVAQQIYSRQSDFDCVLTFLAFKRLPPDMFKHFRIPIVMIDHDICQNYNIRSVRKGEYSKFIMANNIDIVLTSGLYSYEKLLSEGINCIYMPKAAPKSFLLAANNYTGQICFFGAIAKESPVYEERTQLFDNLPTNHLLDKLGTRFGVKGIKIRSAMRYLPHRISMHRLFFPFNQMPQYLKYYSGCIICDKGLQEPMAKHFEVSALGVVPIRDMECEAELNRLGYKNEESMIVYNDFNDLMGKINYYGRHKDELIRMQRNTREVAGMNTWDRRVEILSQAIEDRYSSSQRFLESKVKTQQRY